MQLLSLTIGGESVNAPGGIPTGGLGENQQTIQNAISLMLFIAVTLAIFFLIFGGIQWILSGGEKTKLQAARNKLTYAIIGLVVTFLSFFIISVVGYFFKLDLLKIL